MTQLRKRHGSKNISVQEAQTTYHCSVIFQLFARIQKQSRDTIYQGLRAVVSVCFTCLALTHTHGYAAQQRHAITPELRILLEQAIHSTDSFEDRFDAEVWLTDMSTRLSLRVADNNERLAILRTAHYEATRANLAPELVLAVMEVESGFDRFAISTAGAQGLMQIMPFWLKELKQPQANLFDISTNLRFGCTILKYYLDKEKGDLRRALARYNGSVGKRHYPDKVFTALSERWYRI